MGIGPRLHELSWKNTSLDDEKTEQIEGTYYGQCSELCGIKHAFMPITVKVVSEEDYQEWLSEARIKFAKEEIENDKLKLASK